jgi:hypothetical protein
LQQKRYRVILSTCCFVKFFGQPLKNAQLT